MPGPLIAIIARQIGGELLAGVESELSKLNISGRLELDDGPRRRLLRGLKRAVIVGVNRAAKPVKEREVAEAQAIALHGFTAQAIGTKTRVYDGASSVVAVVGPKMSFSRVAGKFGRGPRKGENRKAVPYLYSWMLVKGTKRSRRRDFLTPAAQGEGAQFNDRCSAEIAAEIAKLLG